MNRTTSGLVRIMMVGLVFLFVVATANAQFKAGIQGTVLDSTGGLVPEAKITLTDKETGKTQETTTSDNGFYRFAALAPADVVDAGRLPPATRGLVAKFGKVVFRKRREGLQCNIAC